MKIHIASRNRSHFAARSPIRWSTIRGRRLLISAGLTALALTMLEAAPADLDATFGAGGKVTTHWSDSAQANALALAGDGKIIVAGVVGNTGPFTQNNLSFAVARYQADGSPDTAFGTNGRVTTDFGTYDQGYAVALQADEKIVVVGSSGESIFFPATSLNFAVARYNAYDGSLDTTFGIGGKVTTDFLGQADEARAVIIEPGTEKIIVVGSAFRSDLLPSFAVARYLPNGTLDPTFGSGGKTTTTISGALGASAQAFGAVIQPDGRIVAVGFARPGFNTDFALVRYLGDGSLDPSFGVGGIVTTDVGEGDKALSVALQPDGRIIVAGTSGVDFTVLRYESDGALDSTFGVGGKVRSLAGHDAAAVTVLANGRIVAAGRRGPFGLFDFGVLMLEPHGTPDVTFGVNGMLTIDFAGNNDEARAIVSQADGRIVVGGIALVSSGYDFALARLEGFPTDTIPPTIGVPDTILTDATSPAGVAVVYSVSVSDNVDPVPTLICSPASGSVFPQLRTTVECTANDAAGNTAHATFDVIVKDANWQLEDVIGLVGSWNLEKLGTSLTDKLSQAQRFNAEGKLKQACDTLGAVLSQVSAQTGKGLTLEQTQELMTRVTRIQNVIGCLLA
jgi:uncharacterized delta-60 repeat protein